MTAPIAAALAGAAGAVAHRGDGVIPPARRLADLTEQLAPIVREFSSIRVDLAQSVGLLDRRDDPADREAGRTTIRDLRVRALANAARMRRVRTSDPELRAVCESLARAQTGQVERLDALGRYVDTGDPAALDAARSALAATRQATRDSEIHQVRYLTRHGLIPQSQPWPGRTDR
jgi:hypothetical protein